MKKIFSILIITLILSSCSNSLEVQPIGVASIDAYLSDAPNIVTAVNATYAALTERNTTNPTSVYNGPIWDLDIVSDDAGATGVLEDIAFDASVATVSVYWQGCYKGIYRSNVILDRLPKSDFSGGSPKLKEQLLGEVYFLRALNYFNLVRAFGDVPLISSEIKSLDEVRVPRSSSTEIYSIIEADLQNAIARLPLKYTGSGLAQEIGRATQGAAKALLAKVFLYQKKYADAARLSKEVINSSVYNLLPDYALNFKGTSENSVESIFEAQYVNSGIGGSFSSRISEDNSVVAYPTDDANISTLNSPISKGGLVQAFTTADRRRILMTNGDRKQLSGLPEKIVNTKYFFISVGNTNSPVNWPIMRFAEVLLINAEAENEVNGPTTAAYSSINRLRERAFGNTNNNIPSGLTKDSFRKAVYDEQRLELWGEGHRFFELVRTERFVAIMTAHLGRTVESRYTKLPIPRAELDRNTALKQTIGW